MIFDNDHVEKLEAAQRAHDKFRGRIEQRVKLLRHILQGQEVLCAKRAMKAVEELECALVEMKGKKDGS